MLRKTCPYSKHCKVQFAHYSTNDNRSGIIDNRILVLPCNKMTEKNVRNLGLAINVRKFDLESEIEKMKKRDCSLYCPDCEGAIKEVKTLEISVGRKCNLDCLMCNLQHYNTIENENFYKKLLDQAKNIKSIKNLYLTCEGEPFAYSWIYDYLEDVAKNSHIKNVFIITNGTLISKDRIKEINEIFIKNKKTLNLTISICSFVKDTYKLIHGVDLLDKILDLISFLEDNNMLNQINYVIQSYNLDEYLNAKNVLETVNANASNKLRFLIDSFTLSAEHQHEVHENVLLNKFELAD